MKVSILVVDDNSETLEVLKRSLQFEGYRIFTAQKVSQAIVILKENHIDLVITDMKMPESNGIGMIKFVRENFSNMKIIVISGYPFPQNLDYSTQNAPDDFLAKPFTSEELVITVQKVLTSGDGIKKNQAE